MLSFSTSWNRPRHRSGEALAEELLGMGIHTIEFGHGLPITLVEGLIRAVDRGDLRVSSVHNFCPHPVEVRGSSPDCYEFTSHRERDRRRAVRLTQQSLQLAERVGAAVVVLHGGRARPLPVYRETFKLVEQGKYLTKEFGKFKVEMVRKREQMGPHFVQRLQEALDEILPQARKAGIVLGIENRERYEDVPSEREIPDLLDRYEEPYLGYWHDFGHAQIKQNLSFLHHQQWLERIGSRAVGCHLHDVLWPHEDHLPPGAGSIDFSKLIPLLPVGIPVVFEMSPEIEKEAVVKAWKMWQERIPE